MTDEDYIALARKEYGDDDVQFDTKAQVVRIALARNMMPALLEAVDRLYDFNQVCSELAAFHPFLADEFQKNKAVLEKLQ